MVKPSWTEVAALVALLFFAAVMAHGWPFEGWGLGWGAIGAVSTLVTGVAACYIAYLQHRKTQAIERQEKRLLSLRLSRLIPWAIGKIDRANDALSDWLLGYGMGFNEVDEKHLTAIIKQQLDDLGRFSVEILTPESLCLLPAEQEKMLSEFQCLLATRRDVDFHLSAAYSGHGLSLSMVEAMTVFFGKLLNQLDIAREDSTYNRAKQKYECLKEHLAICKNSN